jgi:hypothetical protein
MRSQYVPYARGWYTGIKETSKREKKGDGTMYSNEMMENDAVRQDLERRYHKAAETWRFRHLKGKGPQVFAAIVTALLAFFVR